MRRSEPAHVPGTTRITRAALVAALLALAACRTTGGTRPARAAGAEDGDRPPAVVYVPIQPSLIVLGEDQPLLLLHAGVEHARAEALSFSAAFLVSLDPADARAAEAPDRARASAAALLEAYAGMLPPEVRQAEVSAVYGAPGTMGWAIAARSGRRSTGWGGWEVGRARRALVPPLLRQMVRSPQGEQTAVEAARTFMRSTDERDGDAAWDLASIALKAALDRRAFEKVLWPDDRTMARGQRKVLFAQYELHGPEFHVGDLVLVCFMAQDGSVEALHMRLDEDRAWRVAGYARVGTAADAPHPRPGQGMPSRPGAPPPWGAPAGDAL